MEERASAGGSDGRPALLFLKPRAGPRDSFIPPRREPFWLFLQLLNNFRLSLKKPEYGEHFGLLLNSAPAFSKHDTTHTEKKVLSTNTINLLSCPVCVRVQEEVCVLMSSRGFGVSSDSSLKYRGCFCPKLCWSVNAPPVQRCPQAQSEPQP